MANTASRTYGKKRTHYNRFANRRRENALQRFWRLNAAKIILIGLPLIGIFAGFFIGVKVNTYAQSTKINDYGRQMVYATYTVKTGDTIWSIASDLAALNPEFNDIRQYVLAIEKANQNMSGQIKAGQIILIPYFISPDGTVSHDEIYSKYGIGSQK